MKPLDPRLLRHARSVRGVLGVGGLLGTLRTFAIIAWCWCLAQALTALIVPVLGLDERRADAGRVAEGAAAAEQLPWLLAGALAALAVRFGASWAMDVLAARGAIRVKGELRGLALDAIDARSPEWLAGRSDAQTATALGRGLDALDGYFANYVPQLVLAVCATPLLVLAVLLADPVSGVTVLIVFPVIPVFMVLIGLATRAVQDRQWAQLQRLSGAFLDVVEGLATLKIFGRESRQIARIARETDQYRSRTMQVLRVTFLSGFVLDLAGTFSIALVAVTVGTRLVVGEFPLALGLFVLLLLPEVFVPIRQVGAAFHASTEGLAAVNDVFAIVEAPADAPAPAGGAVTSRDAAAGAPAIEFSHVVLTRGPRTVIGPVSFEVRAGEVVALAGPSGAGKSTLVAAALGFIRPDSGNVRVSGERSWAGQRPALLQGTLAENIALGSDTIDAALVRRALDTVGLEDLDASRELGALGAGLSGGQAQRVAIARCLYRAWDRDASVLLLDEPSSALDRASEQRIAAALAAEAAAGRAVLLVSHRPALLDAADRVVSLPAPERLALAQTADERRDS